MVHEQFHIPKISIFQWDAEKYVTIDVRAPLEFAESSLPKAINVPIFNNDERAEVGTVYKSAGKVEAIKLGLTIFSKKIPQLFEIILNLKEQNPHKKIVIVCARGGMRSSSIASTLNTLGIHCYQLDGGFRAYRSLIVEKLKKYAKLEKNYYVISGNTGTKKTKVLQRLKLEGFPVIDLEGLAGHRGSAFGGIGMKARSQKEFEALLIEQFDFYQHSPYLIIEAESKRIGNIIVPDFIIQGKKNGTRIELIHPLANRVQHLIETYEPNKYEIEILTAFHIIKKRIQIDVANEIEYLLMNKQYFQALELLLTKYYDPQYAYASQLYDHHNIEEIKFNELSEAVAGVKNVLSKYEFNLNQCGGMA